MGREGVARALGPGVPPPHLSDLPGHTPGRDVAAEWATGLLLPDAQLGFPARSESRAPCPLLPHLRRQHHLHPERGAGPGLSAHAMHPEAAGLGPLWEARCTLWHSRSQSGDTGLAPGLGEAGAADGVAGSKEEATTGTQAPLQVFRGLRVVWGPQLREACSQPHPSPSLHCWDQRLSGLPSTTASPAGQDRWRGFSCI